jgi:hypothetical protein
MALLPKVHIGSGLLQWKDGLTYLMDLALYLDQRKGGGPYIWQHSFQFNQ